MDRAGSAVRSGGAKPGFPAKERLGSPDASAVLLDVRSAGGPSPDNRASETCSAGRLGIRLGGSGRERFASATRFGGGPSPAHLGSGTGSGLPETRSIAGSGTGRLGSRPRSGGGPSPDHLGSANGSIVLVKMRPLGGSGAAPFGSFPEESASNPSYQCVGCEFPARPALPSSSRAGRSGAPGLRNSEPLIFVLFRPPKSD